MHANGHVPWFGYQLKTGNSLIGARRACYGVADIRSRNWVKREPHPVDVDHDIEETSERIYHFLLPYKDIPRVQSSDQGQDEGRNDLARF